MLAAVALMSLGGCVPSEEDFKADHPEPLNDEGTSAAPDDLGTAPLTYSGTVGIAGLSYYSFDTNPGIFTFTLSGMTENADLFIYDNDSFSNIIGSSTNSGTATDTVTDIPCAESACTGGIIVSQSSGSGGTEFNLVISSQIENEGSSFAPEAIGTAPVSGVGTVAAGGTSYYSVVLGTGTYSFTISDMEEDVDLYVYSDATFSTLIDSSLNSGTSTETASAFCGSSCTVGFKVVHFSGSNGTAYLIDVQ